MASFDGKELSDYGVKSLRRPGNAKKRTAFLCEILVRLFEEKQPDILALEKNSLSNIKQNQLLMLTIQKIKKLASEAKIPVWEFAPNTIKKEIANDDRATNRQIVNVLGAQFPETKAYRASNRQWRERYFQNMFDAVACGLTYIKLYEENRLQ